MRVKRAKTLKDIAFQAHNPEFFGFGIFADVFQNLRLGVYVWNERTKLHTRVKIEEKLIVTENSVSGKHDSRLVDRVLALYFQSRVVKSKATFNSKVNLVHFVVSAH